jgi:hypothetical protein
LQSEAKNMWEEPLVTFGSTSAIRLVELRRTQNLLSSDNLKPLLLDNFLEIRKRVGNGIACHCTSNWKRNLGLQLH